MSGYIGTVPVPQATQTREAFTASANQTSFATIGYEPGFLDVFLNGVKLAAADYTATNAINVVLATGAAVNDILEIVAYKTFNVANTLAPNGSAANLTNLPSAQLTGALPAISGAALTNVPIADQAVNEAKLQVSNAPTNGYALTAQSAANGGMTWAEMSASPIDLISTTTISSNVQNIAFSLPTGYVAYELLLSDIGSTALYPFLQAHYSTDNGSNYDIGNNYRNRAIGNSATNSLRMHDGEMRGPSFFRLLIQGAKMTARTVMTGVGPPCSSATETTYDFTSWLAGGVYVSDSVVTNVRFKFSDNSSFNQGTFSLYGRK